MHKINQAAPKIPNRIRARENAKQRMERNERFQKMWSQPEAPEVKPVGSRAVLIFLGIRTTFAIVTQASCRPAANALNAYEPEHQAKV